MYVGKSEHSPSPEQESRNGNPILENRFWGFHANLSDLITSTILQEKRTENNSQILSQ